MRDLSEAIGSLKRRKMQIIDYVNFEAITAVLGKNPLLSPAQIILYFQQEGNGMY